MEFSTQKNFDKRSYKKSNSEPLQELDDNGMLKGKRDPYFETYAMAFYQETYAENPSAFFNFFLENNHCLKKLDDKDYFELMGKAWQNRVARVNGFFLGLGGTALGQLIWKKASLPRINVKFLRPFVFATKWLLPPFLGYGAGDLLYDIEDDFIDAADKYNFQFEDFKEAMEIFELARQQDKFDDLMKYGISSVDIKGVKFEDGRPTLINPREEL